MGMKLNEREKHTDADGDSSLLAISELKFCVS